jgi:hypothetical protein
VRSVTTAGSSSNKATEPSPRHLCAKIPDTHLVWAGSSGESCDS